MPDRCNRGRGELPGRRMPRMVEIDIAYPGSLIEKQRRCAEPRRADAMRTPTGLARAAASARSATHDQARARSHSTAEALRRQRLQRRRSSGAAVPVARECVATLAMGPSCPARHAGGQTGPGCSSKLGPARLRSTGCPLTRRVQLRLTNTTSLRQQHAGQRPEMNTSTGAIARGTASDDRAKPWRARHGGRGQGALAA
jgi:hypothetical protein